MQIPLLAGRDFQEGDGPASPAVAVINQAFAKAVFGDRNPLGQHLVLWEGKTAARDMTIVGVCGNARYGSLIREFAPVVYMPYDQGYPRPGQMVYALRTRGDPLAYVNAVREIVRRADPRVPVSEVRTQVADIDRTINQEITFARLCSAFAILALVIACVGLYGAVSYNVARRTGEIGIRMALGAQRGGVVQMVLREVLVLAAVGLCAGLAVALATSRFVASFLYGLKPNDPMALALAGDHPAGRRVGGRLRACSKGITNRRRDRASGRVVPQCEPRLAGGLVGVSYGFLFTHDNRWSASSATPVRVTTTGFGSDGSRFRYCSLTAIGPFSTYGLALPIDSTARRAPS